MQDSKRAPKTVFPEQRRSSLATVWVAMSGIVVTFGALALLLTSRHSVADSLLAGIPAPGLATSLASERNLRAHLRIEPPEVWRTRLADNTEVLVAQTTVTNDSFVPVRDIVVSAEAYRRGRRIARAASACGRAFSPTLLGRIKRDELAVALDLPPSGAAIAPGQTTSCQVAFPRSAGGADEVEVRVASAEPLPGHPPSRFLGLE